MNQENLVEATFKNSKIRVLQDKSEFCFGIDAVLIAHFASSKKGKTVFDLGTGTGIIPLLMTKLDEDSRFTALEVQERSAEIARLNVENNNLQERIAVLQADIKDVKKTFAAECADIVVSNPPYAKMNPVKKNPNEAKNIARHEILCNLDDVVSAASWLLKTGGSFFMIHRPERLSEIFAAFSKAHLEAKKLQLVLPFADSSPTMIMIEAKKNARPDLKILAPLVMYKQKGEYTDSIKEIYKNF